MGAKMAGYTIEIPDWYGPCYAGDWGAFLECIEKNPEIRPDQYEQLPLHVALERGHVGMAKHLFEMFPASIYATDNAGYTPLHGLVARSPNKGVDATPFVKLVKEKASDSLAYHTKKGWTLVHTAALFGNLDGAEELLHHVQVNARDNKDNTPLMWAAYSDHVSGIKILLAHGADPSICNSDGRNAKQIAMHRRNFAAFDCLDEMTEEIPPCKR